MNLYQFSLERSRPHGVRALSAAVAVGVALCSVVGMATLSGCGSTGSHTAIGATSRAATGRATLTVTWPARTSSKLIPIASNSIVATFSLGGTVEATQTIARPTSGNTSTVTFDSLPPGTLTLTATAYPTTTGTGTAQATATNSNVVIVANQDTATSVTMASTISALTVTPATSSIASGATTTLTATATDSSGATVLTSTSVTFASSNTAVATVNSSTGVVTGGSTAGTATITATDSESGKSGTANVTVTGSTATTIVDLANAYIATLSTAQQAVVKVDFTVANAEKWSNLPGPPSGTLGTDSRRNGVAYSTLTTAQQTAWNNFVNALLSSAGLTQFNNIRAADYTLLSQYKANGYSGDYQYLAFVGTPSTSGQWMVQLGGHHNAHNYYFTGTTLNTTTPYHLGVEPTSFTYNGTAYSPLSDQKTAVTNLLSSMTTTQLASAKISGSFSDIYLGAGQDARSDFPTASGILVTSLTSAQQTLVKAAIDAWVGKSPLASTYETEYYNELGSTYVGYAGNSSAPGTVFTTQGDYIRIQGPHVWIEFVCQNGVVISSQIHYHTIWRDYTTDYNYQTAGWTLYNHSN